MGRYVRAIEAIEIGDRVTYLIAYHTKLTCRCQPGHPTATPLGLDDADSLSPQTGYVIGIRSVIMGDLASSTTRTSLFGRSITKFSGRKERVLLVAPSKFKNPVIVRFDDVQDFHPVSGICRHIWDKTAQQFI